MLRVVMDYYTKHGAGVLAGKIKDYWLARGCRGVHVERYLIDGDLWGVRSNIVDGYPPRRPVKGAK